MKLKDVGWVWEGQGLDPGVDPSVLGIGDGCRYFGLTRAWYMFHPNNAFAMNRLSWLDEVVCDISKWKWKDSEKGGSDHWVDAAPESIRNEAANVSQLSRDFPNITGAVHDDMLGLVKREHTTPEQYAEIYDALKSENPNLKMWTVVYTHELKPEEWKGFERFMDVICLWVWEAKNIPHMDEGIARCREMFPNKPLIMGCYLRDYPTVAPVPMEMIKLQWEGVLRHIQAGTLDGFSILSANLIDGHQEQANWIRDFIAANS